MNKPKCMLCVGLAALLVTHCARAQESETVPDIVSELESGAIDSASLERILADLTNMAEAGRPIPWDRLVLVIVDNERHGKVRRRVLELVLSEAPKEWRIHSSEHLALAITSAPTDPENETLSGMLLRWLSEQSPEELVGYQAFLEVLVGAAELSMEQFQSLVRVVGNIPNPVAWKSQLGAQLIADHGRATNFSGLAVVDALHEAEVARLRELVRATPATAETFHFGAASALADLGDQETAQLLRQKLMAADERTAAAMHEFIRMIELQRVPSNLVAWATEADEGRQATRRAWALERALELGVSKSELRTAILEYAKGVEPQINSARRAKGAVGASVAASALLGPIKRIGLELQLLQPDDLDYVSLEDPAVP